MAVDRKTMKRAEPRPCEYCECDRVVLRRTVATSGTVMFFWMCAECQDHARRKDQWISHAVINKWVATGRLQSPEAVPIKADYSSEHRCEVCGRAGAEWHHWAPQSMREEFGDGWSSWPGDYLCKEHHRQWHIVVTPQLVKTSPNGRDHVGVTS